MKRERILWPLTHGHQHALSAAKAIRQRGESLRSGDRGLEGLREEVREFWGMELAPHFQAEERMLETLAGEIPPGDPDRERLLRDHRALEGLARKGEDLLSFADLLVEHVHFEEETLFGRVEAALRKGGSAEVEGILRQAAPPEACPRILRP